MAPPDSQSDNKPNRLPFEPASTRPKVSKKPPSEDPATRRSLSTQRKSAEPGIPEVVSRRMARRMALFCGLPSLMGMMTFVGSYSLIQNRWLEVPPVVTLGLSLGFFGIGFLGLSYGLFSASWEEAQVGSLWGWPEFKSNWSKMMEARRSQKNDNDS